VVNTTFGIDESMPGVTVTLESTGGANDYILKVADFDFFNLEIELDNVLITPFGNGYKLSRTQPITFIIPEVYVPPIPPLLPDGGVFTDVPVVITLENTTIVDLVMDLNIKAVATITVVIIVPIPIPITFNISFLGEYISLPPPPPVIITEMLEGGVVNEEYFAILEAESETPVTWSISTGLLPTGLELNPVTGIISGTPTEENIFNFTVMATNESGSDTKPLSIEIEKEIDTVGIAEKHSRASIQVYPNPTTGELSVPSDELQVTSVEVYDMYGRKLFTNHYSLFTPDKVVFNISHLPADVYFVKIRTEAGTITRKIIKN
jgi:hypothetical protein